MNRSRCTPGRIVYHYALPGLGRGVVRSVAFVDTEEWMVEVEWEGSTGSSLHSPRSLREWFDRKFIRAAVDNLRSRGVECIDAVDWLIIPERRS